MEEGKIYHMGSDPLLAAALLNRGGCHDHGHGHRRDFDDCRDRRDWATSEMAGDIRHDIGEGVSDVKESVQALGVDMNGNFRHLDGQVCDASKQAIINAKDAQIKALEVEARTADRFGKVHDRISDFERNVDENFCDVKSSIESVKTEIERTEGRLLLQGERNTRDILTTVKDEFCKTREDALKLRIQELERESDCNKMVGSAVQAIAGQFNNQFQAINSAILTLHSDVRATNQAVNVGGTMLNGQSANANKAGL